MPGPPTLMQEVAGTVWGVWVVFGMEQRGKNLCLARLETDRTDFEGHLVLVADGDVDCLVLPFEAHIVPETLIPVAAVIVGEGVAPEENREFAGLDTNVVGIPLYDGGQDVELDTVEALVFRPTALESNGLVDPGVLVGGGEE